MSLLKTKNKNTTTNNNDTKKKRFLFLCLRTSIFVSSLALWTFIGTKAEVIIIFKLTQEISYLKNSWLFLPLLWDLYYFGLRIQNHVNILASVNENDQLPSVAQEIFICKMIWFLYFKFPKSWGFHQKYTFQVQCVYIRASYFHEFPQMKKMFDKVVEKLIKEGYNNGWYLYVIDKRIRATTKISLFH